MGSDAANAEGTHFPTLTAKVYSPTMCNLYSVTKGQAAIIAITRAMRDRTGNLPPMPGIFPDYLAPIVRRRALHRRQSYRDVGFAITERLSVQNRLSDLPRGCLGRLLALI